MIVIPGVYGHTFSVSGTGAGADSDTSFLADGRPSQVTAFHFTTAVLTTSFVRLTILLTDPDGGTLNVGGVYVCGITGLKVGQKVVVNGDTGHPVYLRKCPTGGLHFLYVPLVPITGDNSITVDIYNDVGGVQGNTTPNYPFWIGDALAGPAFISTVESDWEDSLTDPSVVRDMGDNQPNKLMQVPYREFKLTTSWMPWNEAYGTPATNPWNLNDFRIKVAKCSRSLICPRWRTQFATLAADPESWGATAFLGTMKQCGPIQNKGGTYFQQQFNVREFAHG